VDQQNRRSLTHEFFFSNSGLLSQDLVEKVNKISQDEEWMMLSKKLPQFLIGI
jgi:hypothetical protein